MSNLNAKLEIIAKNIVSKIDHSKIKKDNYGNPIIILMVISIIISLVRVIQDCNKTKDTSRCSAAKLVCTNINSICIKKTWLNQLRMIKIMKKHMSKESYKEYGSELKNAILDYGVSLTEEESLTLMEASNV